MERLVEPIMADLQTEYAEAIDRKRRWRAVGVVIAGYLALAKALLLHGAQASTGLAG